MAEKSTFENELPKKSTVKWLRGLDENGNPVLIDISDHATVVGGLVGVNDTWLRDRGIIPEGSDFNNILPGIYTVNKINLKNQPVNLIGTLLYYGTTYGTQLYTPIADGSFYYRTKDTDTNSWKSWKKLVGVSIG